jgi:hypothetical protein
MAATPVKPRNLKSPIPGQQNFTADFNHRRQSLHWQEI